MKTGRRIKTYYWLWNDEPSENWFKAGGGTTNVLVFKTFMKMDRFVSNYRQKYNHKLSYTKYILTTLHRFKVGSGELRQRR